MLRLAISGPGECGKDTAAEYLASITKLRYVCGTSKFAANIVYEKWGRLQTVGGFLGLVTLPRYRNAEECWEDRRNHRDIWRKIIGEHNASDPVRLYRDCLDAPQDILTGIRIRDEMLAVRDAKLVNLWLWIERKGVPDDPTMGYGPDDCDVVIPNNGTIEEFHNRLDHFAACLRDV